MKSLVLLLVVFVIAGCNTVVKRDTIQYPEGWPLEFVVAPQGAKPYKLDADDRWLLSNTDDSEIEWTDGYSSRTVSRTKDGVYTTWNVYFSSSLSFEHFKLIYDKLFSEQNINVQYEFIDRGAIAQTHCYTLEQNSPLNGSGGKMKIYVSNKYRYNELSISVGYL